MSRFRPGKGRENEAHAAFEHGSQLSALSHKQAQKKLLKPPALLD